MQYRVTYLTGPYKGLTADFSQEIITIGRAAENEMVVDESHISGYHARLVIQEGRVLIDDLGSTNGTFVNGKRVKSPTHLQPGDMIQLGTNVKLKISPLIEDFGDRTVFSTRETLADDVPAPSPPQRPPQYRPQKKPFPVWIMIVILGIVLLCLGVIVLGGGGLVAWTFFQ